VFLSQDTLALAEIQKGVDLHEENRKLLSLPTRLIAKTFLFRLIYGGSCWAYAADPEFTHVSTDPEYWQRVIDEFYGKYSGLARWHEGLVGRAVSDGSITIPSGRVYTFAPYRDKRGEVKWPRTTILNYPVQGFSADLMSIARISAYRRLKGIENVLLCNTVHDDIEIDLDNDPELCYNISQIMIQVFKDIPKNFKKLYGIEFNVPLEGEVSFGHNLKDMKEFHLNKGVDQFATTNPDYQSR
jgi:DNA polymerase I-like protein with 3'-5' exonuclease and polymerase domains